MSKQPKKPGKTTFGGNTEQKIPKIPLKTQQSISKKENSSKKNEEKSEKRSVNFDEPQPSSSKNITEKMNIVKNLKPKDLKENKDDLIKEKITKRMNFPADRAIYKDLIPLGVKRETAQMIVVPQNPLPPNHIKLWLPVSYKPEALPEFIFQIEPDLIPLGVKKETAQIVVPRNPLSPNDIQVCLPMSYKPETLSKFIFQVKPEPVNPGKIEPVNYDGFKITKHM